jgi:hypothetical protein
MQINKKMLSIAVTALLVLSIVAAATPAFAAVTPAVSVPYATTLNANTTPNVPAYPTAFTSPASPGTAVTVVTVGMQVVVSATDAANFNPVSVYWDTVSSATLLGTTSAGAPPNQATPSAFNVTITIPVATHGVHNIIVNDGTGNIAYPVTVASSLSSSPSRALQGESVTLTGRGYAPNSAVTITSTVTGTFTPPAVVTDVNGSFTAVVTVPTDATLSASAYTITATDASSNAGTASVFVGHYVTVTPSGTPIGVVAPVPPGVTVTIAGRITGSTSFSITIDGVNIYSGTSVADGRFSVTYPLPTLISAGSHTINVIATGLTPTTPTTTLYTGAAPQILIRNYGNSATLTGGVPGATVRVITTGGGAFDASANITLTFGTNVVNSTTTDSRFGPTTAAGAVNAEFAVPNLPVGAYTVTLTDQYGATASVSFTINSAAATVVKANVNALVQGDTISFTITSTDTAFAVPRVYIKDPSGLYWWGNPSAPIALAVSTLPDASFIVPFAAQVDGGNNHFTIPSGAPTGDWNWTILYTNSLGAQTATGLITVSAGGISGISTQLNNMNAILMQINGTVATLQTSSGSNVTVDLSSLNAKLDSISGNIASLSTSMGTVTTTVNSLSGTISTINSGVATIKTDLGTVQTSLSSLDAVLGAVAGDTATLKTSIGDVSTSLSSIGTTVTSINGNVATIKTDVGTLSGTVTSISGNVATIQTSIGSMQADISNMQSDVSSSKSSTDSLTPLIIVAIVLALVAAIAAIASIVLMRRKIAG